MASQSFSNCTLTVLTVFIGSLLQPFCNCTTLNFFPFYAYIFIELELQVPRYRAVCAYIFHFYIYTVQVLYRSGRYTLIQATAHCVRVYLLLLYIYSSSSV